MLYTRWEGPCKCPKGRILSGFSAPVGIELLAVMQLFGSLICLPFNTHYSCEMVQCVAQRNEVCDHSLRSPSDPWWSTNLFAGHGHLLVPMGWLPLEPYCFTVPISWSFSPRQKSHLTSLRNCSGLGTWRHGHSQHTPIELWRHSWDPNQWDPAWSCVCTTGSRADDFKETYKAKLCFNAFWTGILGFGHFEPQTMAWINFSCLALMAPFCVSRIFSTSDPTVPVDHWVQKSVGQVSLQNLVYQTVKTCRKNMYSKNSCNKNLKVQYVLMHCSASGSSHRVHWVDGSHFDQSNHRHYGGLEATVCHGGWPKIKTLGIQKLWDRIICEMLTVFWAKLVKKHEPSFVGEHWYSISILEKWR